MIRLSEHLAFFVGGAVNGWAVYGLFYKAPGRKFLIGAMREVPTEERKRDFEPAEVAV